MKVPVGFRFAGAHAGLKPVRRDVALVVSDTPAIAAGCFTQNAAAAAPIVDARPRVLSSSIRAVVINSGNANALTGAAGLQDVLAIRTAVANAMHIDVVEGAARQAVQNLNLMLELSEQAGLTGLRSFYP